MRVSSLVFACYTSACRPPTSGGTGGSNPAGGPYTPPRVDGRVAAAVETARAAVAEAFEPDGTVHGDKVERVEQLVNAAGAAVHQVIERELANDPGMVEIRDKLRDTQERYDLNEDDRLAASHAYNRLGDKATQEQRVAYQDQARAFNAEGNKLFKSLQDLNAAAADRRAQIVAANLGVYRPMGGSFDGTPGHRKPQRGLSINEQLTFTATLYPSDWIKASNLKGSSPYRTATAKAWVRNADGQAEQVTVPLHLVKPLTFRQTTGRAHYKTTKMLTEAQTKYTRNPDGSQTRVSNVSEITLDGTRATAVHEVFHRMEDMVPAVGHIERAFLRRRAGGSLDDTRSLRRTLPNSGFGADEIHVPAAGLFHPYAEKLYQNDHRSYEVGSMGYEYYVTGKKYNGLPPDPDHTATVLGLLLSA